MEDADWSPDGKSLAVARHVGNRNRLDYPIGRVLYDPPGWISDVRVSPDGKWVVATGTDQKIDIYPIEPGEPRAVPGLGPADIPLRWTPDGGSIFVYRPSAPPLRVEKVDVKTGRRTLWKELARDVAAPDRRIAVDPDGQRSAPRAPDDAPWEEGFTTYVLSCGGSTRRWS